MIRTVPRLITAPTAEPVTLDELKMRAAITFTDHDSMLNDFIAAARESAEKFLCRALITQTWGLSIDMPRNNSLDYLPDGMYDLPVSAIYGDLPRSFDLPVKPIQSVSSVKTYSTSNVESTYSADNYFVDSYDGRLVLNETAQWPTDVRARNSVLITYVCGYGAKGTFVPQAIRAAILMHAQKMYDERIVCDMPDSCMNLLQQYRVYGKSVC